MGEKIVIGPITKGLRNDVTPFNIDNDSFPVLVNAYQWRSRVKRKRGTQFLGRLTRYFNSTSLSYNPGALVLTLDGGGNGNILTAFSLQVDGNIVPGSVTLVASGGPTTYTDPTRDGYLTPTGTSGPNTINYATGAILIPAQAGNTVTATFLYYPDLPVMGLEDFISNSTQFPGTLGFDTVYAYNITTTFPALIYDVSFYKNPPATFPTNYPSYVQKATVTPTSWNGEDYQQFWTVNYQGALWATNGIEIPFDPTNVGMQFAPASTITVSSQTATTLVVVITNCPLIVGDFVFVNEFTSTTPANATTLNLQTGYVTACSPNTPPLATKTLTITFPYAMIATDTYTPGIIQYLTNRSDVTKDCLRWYDGDATNGSPTSPVLNGNLGWVNFAPPISNLPDFIEDLPTAQYYLIGARAIVPFKDRLLFIGPVLQTSSANSQVYLPDTIIYSQNGTPYYTASFTGDPTFANTVFRPILTPVNQTATPLAYAEDVTGFGGFIAAGLDQAINTVGINEDVLILGFDKQQVRLAFSGNDIIPFNLFIINSELGSSSTFSSVILDEGVLSIGSRGIILTGQTQVRRIDLEIPDEVFQFSLLQNGTERVCAQRDYISEWIYFTYRSNSSNVAVYEFPTRTLQYNYRDNSWAIFNESYTTYGSFRPQSGYTWQTIGTRYRSWEQWNAAWDSSSSTLLQPLIIAGNQQGFVLVRLSSTEGTSEGTSLYIRAFSNSVVTAPNHCLSTGDYITISGCIGTVASEVNGKIFSVFVQDANTFILDPTIIPGLTYSGGGLITRMYVPQIKTKQFPVAWDMARKTRLGPQQYLLTTTAISQITLLIFLSQSNVPYNNPEFPYPVQIVPSPDSQNNSLIYSTVLYTCPESTNLGLTPANINLQTPTASQQSQIWHRMNTSLIGDTVQIGFTMNDQQMRDQGFNNQFSEIELHSIILDVSPSQLLA